MADSPRTRQRRAPATPRHVQAPTDRDAWEEDRPDAGSAVRFVSGGRTWQGWSAPEVIHVGSLVASDKQHDSYEGRGLSVSTTPDAWVSIARLGGSPWWSLRPPTGQDAMAPGGVFLDVHAEKKAITSAAITAGLLDRSRRYQASHTDDNDEVFHTIHATRAEALYEADDEPERVKPITTLVATDALRQRLGRHRVEDVTAFDLAATELVDQGIIRADGLFWNDRYDPGSLSAPRAVIVPSRLAAWMPSARPVGRR